MEHVSLHGSVIVALQLLIVLVLLWGLHRWHTGDGRQREEDGDGGTRRSNRARHGIPLLVGLGFVAWYFVLRTRPFERGADPFHYTLGVFDGVSLAGIIMLVFLHILLTRRTDLPDIDRRRPEEKEARDEKD